MRRTSQFLKPTAAIVVFAVTLGLGSSAGAEPRIGADRAELRQQLADLQRRERELKREIQRVEAELERENRAQAMSLAASAAAECLVPFYLDGMGIKHLRPECVATTSLASCDVPFNLDGRGVRHFRDSCATHAGAPSGGSDE